MPNLYGTPSPQGTAGGYGMPMNTYGASTGGAPSPATSSPSPLTGFAPLHAAMSGMYGMGQGTGAAIMPPQAPPQAPPGGKRALNVGQNGFGIHPDVTHDDIVDYLLPRFRSVESSDNYKAQHPDPKMTASGAYGYTDPTWNNFKGFPRALHAPPEIQDERMKQDLTASLARFGGDVFKATANHYYPAYSRDPSKWEDPLVDRYGKPIPKAQTVREYLEKVLPAERVARYLQGSDTNGQGSNNRAAL